MRRVVTTLSLLAFVFGAFAFAGCGGGDSGPAAGPEGVAREFLTAIVEDDADTAYGLLSAPSKTGISKEELIEDDDMFKNFKLGSASVDGDRARVEITLTFEEEGMEADMTFNLVMVDEDGNWRISMDETEMEIEKAVEKMVEDMMDEFGGMEEWEDLEPPE